LNVHEYQAKEILARYGVPVAGGDVAETPERAREIADRLGGKVVVKAQVHAGGRGKGDDYRPLRETVRRRAARLVTMGEDAPAIEEAFGDVVPSERAAGMDDAVARARALAAPGWAVLLSPACASFDLYNNFEERGRDFKRAVRAACGLPAEPAPENAP